jgi:hypothetical protein
MTREMEIKGDEPGIFDLGDRVVWCYLPDQEFVIHDFTTSGKAMLDYPDGRRFFYCDVEELTNLDG